MKTPKCVALEDIISVVESHPGTLGMTGLAMMPSQQQGQQQAQQGQQGQQLANCLTLIFMLRGQSLGSRPKSQRGAAAAAGATTETLELSLPTPEAKASVVHLLTTLVANRDKASTMASLLVDEAVAAAVASGTSGRQRRPSNNNSSNNSNTSGIGSGRLGHLAVDTTSAALTLDELANRSGLVSRSGGGKYEYDHNDDREEASEWAKAEPLRIRRKDTAASVFGPVEWMRFDPRSSERALEFWARADGADDNAVSNEGFPWAVPLEQDSSLLGHLVPNSIGLRVPASEIDMLEDFAVDSDDEEGAEAPEYAVSITLRNFRGRVDVDLSGVPEAPRQAWLALLRQAMLAAGARATSITATLHGSPAGGAAVGTAGGGGGGGGGGDGGGALSDMDGEAAKKDRQKKRRRRKKRNEAAIKKMQDGLVLAQKAAASADSTDVDAGEYKTPCFAWVSQSKQFVCWAQGDARPKSAAMGSDMGMVAMSAAGRLQFVRVGDLASVRKGLPERLPKALVQAAEASPGAEPLELLRLKDRALTLDYNPAGGPSKGVDLAFQTQTERDVWLRGLRALIDPSGGKTGDEDGDDGDGDDDAVESVQALQLAEKRRDRLCEGFAVAKKGGQEKRYQRPHTLWLSADYKFLCWTKGSSQKAAPVVPVANVNELLLQSAPVQKQFDYARVTDVTNLRVGPPETLDPSMKGDAQLLGDLCLSVTYKAVAAVAGGRAGAGDAAAPVAVLDVYFDSAVAQRLVFGALAKLCALTFPPTSTEGKLMAASTGSAWDSARKLLHSGRLSPQAIKLVDSVQALRRDLAVVMEGAACSKKYATEAEYQKKPRFVWLSESTKFLCWTKTAERPLDCQSDTEILGMVRSALQCSAGQCRAVQCSAWVGGCWGGWVARDRKRRDADGRAARAATGWVASWAREACVLSAVLPASVRSSHAPVPSCGWGRLLFQAQTPHLFCRPVSHPLARSLSQIHRDPSIRPSPDVTHPPTHSPTRPPAHRASARKSSLCPCARSRQLCVAPLPSSPRR